MFFVIFLIGIIHATGVASESCAEGSRYPLRVSSCTSYYECIQGRYEILHCPTGTAYNTLNSTCIDKNQVVCPNNCQEGKIYIHQQIETFYQLCHLGKLRLQLCPLGTKINVNNGKCEKEDTTEICINEEKIKDSKNHKAYKKCKNGKWIRKMCHKETHFNENLQTCTKKTNNDSDDSKIGLYSSIMPKIKLSKSFFCPESTKRPTTSSTTAETTTDTGEVTAITVKPITVTQITAVTLGPTDRTSGTTAGSVTQPTEPTPGSKVTEITPVTLIPSTDITLATLSPATEVTETTPVTLSPSTDVTPPTLSPATEVTEITPVTLSPLADVTSATFSSATEVTEITPVTLSSTTDVTPASLSPATEVAENTPAAEITEMTPATKVTEITPETKKTEITPTTDVTELTSTNKPTDVTEKSALSKRMHDFIKAFWPRLLVN